MKRFHRHLSGSLIRRIVVLALAYYAIGLGGLTSADYHSSATLIWPPTGLSLAVLILFGVELWPGVFLGALLLNGSGTELSWIGSLGVAIGNTLEAVVGTLLLVRAAGFRPSFDRVRDVIAFLGIGALVCTAVSATFGVASLVLTDEIGNADPSIVWMIWWLGDAGGAITLAPVLLIAARGAPSWSEVVRNGEFWVVLALIVALSAWSVSSAAAGASWELVELFAPFPLVVWAGTRLGSRGAVLATFAILAITTLATARGSSPFVVEETTGSMLMLWAYGITMGTTALTLAAATGQRDLAERRFQSEEARHHRSERERLLMEERARIIREMHDGLGNQLVSTLSMVQQGHATESDVIENLHRALDDMRIVIDSLDPKTTDFPTSLGKLRARLESLLRRNDIRLIWKVAISPEFSRFSPEESLHLLRIIQEAVTNAVRHADADAIEVNCSVHGGARRSLSVEIRDDGSGIEDAATKSGRGIRNMEARAELLGAEFELESGETGTRVCVRVALDD